MYQENSSPATIQKALYWLNKQDENWSKHIKDSNTAVKMYLKSHKKPSQASPFQKKLEKFCETNFGVLLQKPHQSLSPETLSPPQENLAESQLTISVKKETYNQDSYKSFESFPAAQNKTTSQKKTNSDHSLLKQNKISALSSQNYTFYEDKFFTGITKEQGNSNKKNPNLNPETYKNFKFPLVEQDPSAELKETNPNSEQKTTLQKTNFKTQKDTKSITLNSAKLQAHEESSAIPADSVISAAVKSLAGIHITLDSKNFQVLEEVKKEWNLKTNEEALNLLIQAGKRNLNSL